MTGHEWSLGEKVGQLFMVGFEGTQVTSQLADWLQQFAWGGIILFGRNVESPEQVKMLVQAVQAATPSPEDFPLLVAVDQEGGRVARLQAPFTVFPSAAVLGRLDSEQLLYEVGRVIALELCAVGITMNMAPVMDVLTNPGNTVIGDRAFSDDPQRVARLGTAFINGMHAGGGLATAKHFPGHGDTYLDSHIARPTSTRSSAQLEAIELLPFREAIRAGVDAIMTAHVIYPAWDSRYPATLSRAILTGILRQTLGFAGVIITDDLVMSAVSDAFPWEEIPLRALQAGADLLLICHHRHRQEQAYARVLAAVQQGELPESMIDQALTRIQALKARLTAMTRSTDPPITCAGIGSATHRALLELVVGRAVDIAHKGA